MSKLKISETIGLIGDRVKVAAFRLGSSTQLIVEETSNIAKETGKKVLQKGASVTYNTVQYMRDEGFDKAKDIAIKSGKFVWNNMQKRVDKHYEHIEKYENYSTEKLLEKLKTGYLSSEEAFAIRSILNERGYFQE